MTKQDPTAKKSLVQTILTDRTFVIAAVVLLFSAAGWSIAAKWFDIFLEKNPVFWPEVTTIRSADDLRLVFPKRLDPYEMVPGSDQKIDDETLEQLKIGSMLDKMRYDSRTSNWYLSRIYTNIQSGTESAGPYNAWYLQIFFYNGGPGIVPHVPERCRSQAGARILQSGTTVLDLSLSDYPEWNGQVDFQRVLFEQTSPGSFVTEQRAEYYIFALNGKPEADWKSVRLGMRSPFVSHGYFAKIQFGPLGNGSIDPDEADKQAREFMQIFLPEILKNLPTPQDVERASQDG